MKHIGIFIVSLIALCATSACTHNNGDIGFLFGQWRLHEITNGNTTEPCDTVFFAFQSNVVQLRKVVYESYDYNVLTGLYEQDADRLKCSFLNINGTDAIEEQEKKQMLDVLASLHIAETCPTFQVVRLTKDVMTLQYDCYTYHLEKLQ